MNTNVDSNLNRTADIFRDHVGHLHMFVCAYLDVTVIVKI